MGFHVFENDAFQASSCLPFVADMAKGYASNPTAREEEYDKGGLNDDGPNVDDWRLAWHLFDEIHGKRKRNAR